MLAANGRFISITFAQPHFRKKLYARQRYEWDIRTSTFGHHFHFFFYVMTKGQRLSLHDLELERHDLENQPAYLQQQQPTLLADDNDDNYLNSIEM